MITKKNNIEILKLEILERRFKRLLDGKIKEIEYQNKIFMLHPDEKNKILTLDKDRLNEFDLTFTKGD
jgi:hypothetical protein